MPMKSSRFCCGAAVDNASYIVSFIEIISGVILCIGFLVLRNAMCIVTKTKPCFKLNRWQDFSDLSLQSDQRKVVENVELIYYWVFTAYVVANGIQAGMGIFLCIAVKMKSSGLIKLWLISAVMTCLFTVFILRVFDILVVQECYREVRMNRKLDDISKSIGHHNSIPGLVEKFPPQPQPHIPANIEC